MSPKSWLKGDAIKGTFQHLLKLRNGRKDKPRQISLSPSYLKTHLIKKNHKLFTKRKRTYVWMCMMYITDVKYLNAQRHINLCCEIFISKWSHFAHILESVFSCSVCTQHTRKVCKICHDCHPMGSEILEPAPNPHRRHFQCLGGHDGGCGYFWRSDHDLIQAMDKTLKSGYLIIPNPQRVMQTGRMRSGFGNRATKTLS